MDTTMSRSAGWDRASLWVQRHHGQSGIPADSIFESVRPLFFIHRYQPVRSTYVSLLSSGDLALIRDEGIRSQIVEYYERRQPYMRALAEASIRRSEKFSDISYRVMLWTQSNPQATSIRDEGSGAGFKLVQPWATGSKAPEFVYEATTLGLAGAVIVRHFSIGTAENKALRSAIAEYRRD